MKRLQRGATNAARHDAHQSIAPNCLELSQIQVCIDDVVVDCVWHSFGTPPTRLIVGFGRSPRMSSLDDFDNRNQQH